MGVRETEDDLEYQERSGELEGRGRQRSHRAGWGPFGQKARMQTHR